MASRLWTGSISFGLVNIPVSLVTAEVHEELDFTLLDKRDDPPIGYQKKSLAKAGPRRKREEHPRPRRRKTA